MARDQLALGEAGPAIFPAASKLRLLVPWWLIADGVAKRGMGGALAQATHVLSGDGYNALSLGSSPVTPVLLIMGGIGTFLLGAYLNRVNRDWLRAIFPPV